MGSLPPGSASKPNCGIRVLWVPSPEPFRNMGGEAVSVAVFGSGSQPCS